MCNVCASLSLFLCLFHTNKSSTLLVLHCINLLLFFSCFIRMIGKWYTHMGSGECPNGFNLHFATLIHSFIHSFILHRRRRSNVSTTAKRVLCIHHHTRCQRRCTTIRVSICCINREGRDYNAVNRSHTHTHIRTHTHTHTHTHLRFLTPCVVPSTKQVSILRSANTMRCTTTTFHALYVTAIAPTFRTLS